MKEGIVEVTGYVVLTLEFRRVGDGLHIAKSLVQQPLVGLYQKQTKELRKLCCFT
jgi:hypothetical protein